MEYLDGILHQGDALVVGSTLCSAGICAVAHCAYISGGVLVAYIVCECFGSVCVSFGIG